MMFNETFANKRVLVTGHTGFKGSWLTLWLEKLGAEVLGVSLAEREFPNHFDILELNTRSAFQDLLELEKLQDLVLEFQPDFVFHLAAQSLVNESYRNPYATFNTNIMGTASILEALRHCDNKVVIVVVTTDKVYANDETGIAFSEDSRLGGYDPYSSSKAASELVAESYRKSFAGSSSISISTVRAGNVIGGGDWSNERLLPDMFRSLSTNTELIVRNPESTRPWQHVLDCLSGYLLVAAKQFEFGSAFEKAWNFGPMDSESLSVLSVVSQVQRSWSELDVVFKESKSVEAKLLSLNTSQAREELGWSPVWTSSIAIEKAVEWYTSFHSTSRVLSSDQLEQYVQDARSKGQPWAKTK